MRYIVFALVVGCSGDAFTAREDANQSFVDAGSAGIGGKAHSGEGGSSGQASGGNESGGQTGFGANGGTLNTGSFAGNPSSGGASSSSGGTMGSAGKSGESAGNSGNAGISGAGGNQAGSAGMGGEMGAAGNGAGGSQLTCSGVVCGPCLNGQTQTNEGTTYVIKGDSWVPYCNGVKCGCMCPAPKKTCSDGQSVTCGC